MTDLGPQIVVAATAVVSSLVSFFAGMVVESLRHRQQRRAKLHDERISTYSSYISTVHGERTALMGLLTGAQALRELLERGHQQEALLGALRLLSNDEVRKALDRLSVARDEFGRITTGVRVSRRDAVVLVRRAWDATMRDRVAELEEAMRRHLDMEAAGGRSRWQRGRKG